MDKKLKAAIMRLKADVTTALGVGGDFIPEPLARDFIRFVRDRNFMRQLHRVIFMPSKTHDFPKVLGKTKVYYRSAELVAARKSGLTTGTIRLNARKLMSRIDASEEVLEDAQNDMDLLIRDHFGEQMASAEEEAMISGDRNHTPLTSTESAATATTWFDEDHRLAIDGILTLAKDIAGFFDDENRAANRVNASGNDFATIHLRQAMFNLRKYGRVMNDLITVANPWSSNQLLDDAKLVTVEKYGPNATILTGEFGKLYGRITMVNSPFMEDGHAVMTHRNNGIIGDRRRVKLKSKEEIEDDSRRYVISERIDFQVQYQPALCNIFNLDTPPTES